MVFSDKLISLLRTFSKYELNRFRKFLLSPYFNEQDALLHLFEAINKALRQGEPAIAALDKEKAWKAMYPRQTLDEAQLRRCASDLNRLALQFLAQETRQEEPLADAFALQKRLDRPEVSKHLNSVERQIATQLAEMPGKDLRYYQWQYQYEANLSVRYSKKMVGPEYADKLTASDQALACFYIIQKLKYYVAWLTLQSLRATTGRDFGVIPGFWEYISAGQFESVPLIAIYKHVVICLKEPDEEAHFPVFLEVLERYAPELSKEDLRECYQIAQNYCAFKVNQGKTEYYPLLFQILKTEIARGVLVENEQLSESVFKNVVTISLWVREYEWTENFIKTHYQYLPVDIRDNAQVFNLANLYWHQKKHQKVIELLRSVEYSDVIYALGAKLILVRTYFETKEFLALDSLIDSFRIFLRRNKVLSKNLKREYNSFLNFVKKLTSLGPSDKEGLARLKANLQQVSATTPKKWLLEKIEEIERGRGR